MVALKVLWWAISVLLPKESNPSVLSSLPEICSIESTLALAAASSMASGIPSSW